LKNKIAIIIGAGPAGLTAAYELLKQTDYIPIVIEADSQVGGLSKTVDYKGNKIDIGGHRFFSKSQRVLDWWLQFLPLQLNKDNEYPEINYQNKQTTFTNHSIVHDPEKVMLLRPRKSRILFSKQFFGYPLKLNADTIKKLGIFKLFKAGVSYVYAKIFPLKEEKNLAQFFRNRFGKELYVTFFKDYTEKVWGVACEDMPAEWGKQRIKDLNVGKVLSNAIKSIFVTNKTLLQQGTSTSLIEQFLYPKYGPGQMWEKVADEIIKLGGTIQLNTKVEQINFAESFIQSVQTINSITKQSSTIETEVIFSTMPVRELIACSKGIEFADAVKTTASNLQYRDFLIVGLLVSKLSLKEKNITDNWIYLQDKGIKAGRLQLFNNWSPGMVQNPDKIWMGVEFFCNDTEAFWLQSDEQIIKQAIKEMEQTGLLNVADVEDGMVLRVPKAYPSYYGAYNNFETVKNALMSIPNLHCIGRNGMHKYNNSDHSMLTAMEAVNHLKNGGDKNIIWDINTDEDYHEEK
jgi:protoporphyrinogen oxidase